MVKITYFVPGNTLSQPGKAERWSPLHMYLPSMPSGVATAYINAMTQPGDLILDPFCQTPQIIQEGLALGRRVLAANFNPVTIRAIDLALAWQDWPDRPAINIAFTHLTENPRSSTPNQPGEALPARLAMHYATHCPTCKKSARAESFVWDRDQGKPVEKHVRCMQCNAESRGPVDQADLALLKRYEPRSLPYWLLLDRVATPDDSDERERAAAVLATYTPRTLAAISDILIRFDALPEAERAALRPLLLETFVVCSSLYPDEAAHPTRTRALKAGSSLKLPPRFIERNVWRALQDALKRSLADTPEAGLPRATDLNTLIARREPAAYSVARNSREIAKLLEPGSIALAIGMPPELDTSFWALSAVWSAWLWGTRAADVLRPLLGRRRADVEWSWRVLAAALGALAPTLVDQGKFVLVCPSTSDEWLGGLTLAGAASGLELEHALAEPHDGLRLAWTYKAAPSTSRRKTAERQLDIDALGMEVMEVAERAALQVIRARGEPVTWIQLASGIYQELAETDLLKIAANLPDSAPPPLALLTNLVRGTFEGRETPLQRTAYPLPAPQVQAGRAGGQAGEGGDQIWWVNRLLAKMNLPLSDTVEMIVYDTLRKVTELDEATLINRIYQDLAGVFTPERALVAMCLDSYSQLARPSVYALRKEDRFDARQKEIELLRGELAALGKRMNWDVNEHDNNCVVWAEKRRTVYTFVFSATAQLAPHLLAKRPPLGTPVLVIPGGRSGLIEYKLRRNVQFRDAMMGAGWQFLKFRHLRTLAANPSLSQDSFQASLGLDPLVESERQLSLL